MTYQIPSLLYRRQNMTTWLVVGGNRGIGMEFVKQLLAKGHRILVTVRDMARASALWNLAGSYQGVFQLFTCDVLSEANISLRRNEDIRGYRIDLLTFVGELKNVPDLTIDYVVICAGVLRYPNVGCSLFLTEDQPLMFNQRATELSFEEFAFHLHTNTIGPIIMAKHLLQSDISIGSIVFMSSDSGSATRFLDRADGFAAYAASKAALNQALRHMAAELRRNGNDTIILALHPGEVAT